MQVITRLSVFYITFFALLVGCGPSAESQTLRDRLRERAAKRQAGQTQSQTPANFQQVNLQVGGVGRSFLVYVPKNVRKNAPVLMVIHGGGGNASGFAGRQNFSSYADQRGFVLVYPSSVEKNWNDGRETYANQPNDVAYLRAVNGYLRKSYGTSPNKVFFTGISSGGMMAHRMACDAPEITAGIAPVAASFSEALLGKCKGAQSTPVIMFSGTDDPLMRYEGGRPQARGVAGGTDVIVPAPDTIAFWAREAGCGGANSTQMPDRANDGTTVTKISYSCPRDQVQLYRIDGGGHTWPGGSGSKRLERMTGPTSKDVDASFLIVKFFTRYGL